MEPVLVYITARDKLQAVNIARALLEARLIACANILPGATSLYRWEGKLEEAEECVLIAKSMQSKAAEITRKVKALHSYDCPCVVAVPLAGGNPAFLRWVEQETKTG